MGMSKYVITIILVSLLLLTQVLLMILLTVRWCRHYYPGKNVDMLSEHLTYTLLAPVSSIILSLLDPAVHSFVVDHVVAWFFVSVVAIGIIMKIVEATRGKADFPTDPLGRRH